MSERLGTEEVTRIAGLARLELSAEETERFASELSAVLDHVAALAALDTSSFAPTAHALELENVLRPDTPTPGLARDEVLAAAPAAEDGRFRVPRILGEAP
jgi:aspartyl-tRNA(Asn)/glutamyl-tRNA(Gln) amidotransferase subunit C